MVKFYRIQLTSVIALTTLCMCR